MAMGFACDFLRRKGATMEAEFFGKNFVSIALFGLLLSKILFLSFVPNVFGIGFVRAYYGFFTLGALYYLYGRELLRGPARLLPYVLFISLAPLWYRLHSNILADLVVPFIGEGAADASFHVLVALCGIFMTMDIVKILCAVNIVLLNRFLAYCGIASLGIYVMQFYILGYGPPVIGPLLICLVAYAILSRIPVARLIFLGEIGKNMSSKMVFSSVAQTDKAQSQDSLSS
jgi:hypothetical protein